MKKKTSPPQKAPFFSVVMPLYNKASYVRRSIDSILRQTFVDFELFVIDDGSTDNGAKIVRSIQDQRIRVIAQRNAGVSAARNKGVECARGKYVAFLDADDEWEPDYLETLKGLILDFPGAGLYATNYRVQDGEKTRENHVSLAPGWRGLMRDFYSLSYGERIPIHTSSVCLPKGVARQNPFPVGIKAGEDIYVWFKVCLKHEMAYLNRPHSIWHLQTTENAHWRYFGPQYHLDWLAIGERLRNEKALPETAEKFITFVALVQAQKMILHGERRIALAQWWRCPKHHFLLQQVRLLFLAVSPLKLHQTYREVFHKFTETHPVQSPKKPPRESGPHRVKNSPFFSVIIPLYNKKDYIRRAAGSVLGQTFRDFELIVVDDGSKDGSPGIVRSLKDKRVRLIIQKNAGVSAARNRGVAAAKGSYVAFLDADDDWDSDYLTALRELILDFPGAGLYGTNYWIDDGSGRQENPLRLPTGWRGRMRDYYDLVYYGRPPFCTNTVCLPTGLAKETPFPPGIKAGEDLLVWFKVSLKHDTVFLNRPLSTYYVEASDNTHKAYFGPQYHLDWLDLGEQLKREKILPKNGEKYVVWATLIQVRKMIANGYLREAWSKWWRCPKTYFPLYQAALLLMFLFPMKQRKYLKPAFFRRLQPAAKTPVRKPESETL